MSSPSINANNNDTTACSQIVQDGTSSEEPDFVKDSKDDKNAATATASNSGTPAEAETNGAVINPVTDFVTTSYVLDTINSALEETMNGMNPLTSSGETQQQKQKGYFELQKRMPDGSARKATEEEITSADMKNKLEQAAQLTSKMTLEQKVEWAQKQRQSGNELYQQQKFKEAIDIYLTCLVVRDTTQNQQKVVDQDVLILPVMNNLAQCSLQLGWYHKAELFCTLGLEALGDDSRGQSVAKLYFKRGKARRLRGWYDEAKGDLERALVALWNRTEIAVDKTAEQKSIEREFQLLHKAIVEGKKNKDRAQRAMQKVLGSSSVKETGTANASLNEDGSVTKQSPSTNSNDNTKAAASTPQENQGLYHEKHVRTYSTIRKRPEGPPPYEKARLPGLQLSYWQTYRLVAARVAQKLLDIIGEEEGNGFGTEASNLDETENGAKLD